MLVGVFIDITHLFMILRSQPDQNKFSRFSMRNEEAKIRIAKK